MAKKRLPPLYTRKHESVWVGCSESSFHPAVLGRINKSIGNLNIVAKRYGLYEVTETVVRASICPATGEAKSVSVDLVQSGIESYYITHRWRNRMLRIILNLPLHVQYNRDLEVAQGFFALRRNDVG